MYKHVPVFQAMEDVSWTTLHKRSSRLRTFEMPWKRNRYKNEANEGTRREKPIWGCAHLYNAVAETWSSDVRRTSIEALAGSGAG